MTELLELLGPGECCEEGPAREPLLNLRLLDRDGQGTDPDRVACIRVAQSGLDRAEVAIGRADEQHGDLLPLEAVCHHELVRAVDERPVGRTRLGERVDLRLEGIATGLGTANVFLQAVALGIAEPVRGERHPDQDPDHEREKDRGQRGDVVAKVEHTRNEPPSELCASLAQGVEPGQCAPGQRPAEPVQPRRLDRKGCERPVRAVLLEFQLGVDVVADQGPGEALGALDAAHEQLAAGGCPTEERRAVVTLNVPAGALRDAAAVRLDAGDPRPPVGKVVRLRDERPHVVARREEQARG